MVRLVVFLAYLHVGRLLRSLLVSHMSEREKLSTRNVGSLTTYDLRQELVRRNVLDIPEESINHRSMLQRLVQELMKDEQKETDTNLVQSELSREEEMIAKKKERERKKQEAIEKSQQRQADANYFRSMRDKNEEAMEIRKSREMEKRGTTSISELMDQNSSEVNEGEEEEESRPSDPFRICSSGRNKLFVR